METKQDLMNKIKELLEIDNKIILLKREKDKLDKEKKKMSQELMAVMKQHEINSVNTKNSVLIYKAHKTRPFNKKTLQVLLSSYYKEDTETAETVKNYIFDNIPVKLTDRLTRKIVAPIEGVDDMDEDNDGIEYDT